MPQCQSKCPTVKQNLKRRNEQEREGKPREDSRTVLKEENSGGTSSRRPSKEHIVKQRSREDPNGSPRKKSDRSLKRNISDNEKIVSERHANVEERELDFEAPTLKVSSRTRNHGSTRTRYEEDAEGSKIRSSSKTSNLEKSLGSKVSKTSSRKAVLGSTVNDRHERTCFSDLKYDKIEEVNSGRNVVKRTRREKQRRDEYEGLAADNSESSINSGTYDDDADDLDQRRHVQCSSECVLGKSKGSKGSRGRRFRKRTKKEQEMLDRYVLNEGFNYFKDICTCSYMCLSRQIVNDSFVRSTFASAVLFILGIKLCLELNAWYIPSDVT